LVNAFNVIVGAKHVRASLRMNLVSCMHMLRPYSDDSLSTDDGND